MTKQLPSVGHSSIEERITDEDIYGAMKEMHGYLDITPGDLKEVFRLAFSHALKRLSTAILARDIMTKAVHSVRPETLLVDVAVLMAREGISGVPVVDDGNGIIGVISENDFLAKISDPDSRHAMGLVSACLRGTSCLLAHIRKGSARDIMTSPAITVSEETPVFTIMEMFRSRRINRVPVVNSSNELKGIISRGDIMHLKLMKTEDSQSG